MLVYESTKQEFLEDFVKDKLTDNIINNFHEKIGKVNEAEVRSWDNSMQYMFRVLNDPEIPNNSGIAIEFRIPYSSKRVDFLITGRTEETENVVIVELKQWDKIEKVSGKEAIVKTPMRYGIIETTHPSYQAWSYACLIEDYNENVQQEKINLYPSAYLHNYRIKDKAASDPLLDPIYEYYIEKAPIFTKGDTEKLRNFIKKYIKFGDNKQILYKIEKGKIRPSKSLQDTLNSMLKGNKEFIMIDEQKVVYEEALRITNEALRTGTKQVLIVEGGPGTGKSVLAINLLVELTNRNLVAQYVTRNATPRNVYSAKLKGDFRKTRIDNLFKGSGSYIDASKDEFDVLIVDEAHRLTEKTGFFKKGENQIKEIIHAAKTSIFFIDERQKVRIDDFGSIGEIEKQSKELGGNVRRMQLVSQFRCNGSDGYLAWIDDVLQIRETANINYIGMDYDFRVYDNPNELLKDIKEYNKINNKSRIVAGYCWDWNKDTRSDANVPDIIIPEHNFAMSWNLDNTDTWAIDENSVNQAGVIHTCQGLEFDYVGVIIGDDLIYRNEKVLTDYTKRAKTDKSIHGINKMMKEDPEKATKLVDEIIRNTYRTLLTRGQKGCFVFCTDKPLANYLKYRYSKVLEYQEDKFFKDSIVAEHKLDYDHNN